MHKAELQLIIMKNDIFGTFSFWLDKLGTLGLGIILKLLLDGNFNWSVHGFTTVSGISLFVLGFYYSQKKAKNIDNILQEKMKSISE